MTRVLPSIVDLLLRALDPCERQVVEGDLRELRLPPARALGEVLGLVVRRQIAAWLEWRAWAALLAIALPLALLLGLLSRYWANAAAVASWFYIDNWTPSYLGSPAARGDLAGAIATSLVQCAALACWAWTAGCTLATLSRRTAWTTSAAFVIVLFAATAGTTTAAVRNPANAAVFSAAFYRAGLPLAFRVVFVLLPALHGMRRAARQAPIALPPSVALAGVVAMLTALVWRGPQGAMLFGWWSLSADGPVLAAMTPFGGAWPLRLLPIGLLLPSVYIVSNAARRSRALVSI
jgi:hypothetical protein